VDERLVAAGRLQHLDPNDEHCGLEQAVPARDAEQHDGRGHQAQLQLLQGQHQQHRRVRVRPDLEGVVSHPPLLSLALAARQGGVLQHRRPRDAHEQAQRAHRGEQVPRVRDEAAVPVQPVEVVPLAQHREAAGQHLARDRTAAEPDVHLVAAEDDVRGRQHLRRLLPAQGLRAGRVCVSGIQATASTAFLTHIYTLHVLHKCQDRQ